MSPAVRGETVVELKMKAIMRKNEIKKKGEERKSGKMSVCRSKLVSQRKRTVTYDVHR